MTEFLPSRHRRRIVLADWMDAEELAAWHMRRAGFPDATLTGPGTDKGVDVVADQAVAQVKHTAKPVGAPEVQRLVGAAPTSYHQRLFYSLSGFTQQASRYADDASVLLFEYTIYGDITPANALAAALVDDGGSPAPAEVDEGTDQDEAVAHLGERIKRHGPLTPAEDHDLLVFVTRTLVDLLIPHDQTADDLAEVAACKDTPSLAPLGQQYEQGVRSLVADVVEAMVDIKDRHWPSWCTSLEDFLERSRRLELMKGALEEADRWDQPADVEARFLPRCPPGDALLWHWWDDRAPRERLRAWRPVRSDDVPSGPIWMARETLRLQPRQPRDEVFSSGPEVESLAELWEEFTDSEDAYELLDENWVWVLRAVIVAEPLGLSPEQVEDVLTEAEESRRYLEGSSKVLA